MQFRDLNRQYLKYKTQIDDAVHRVFEKTNFISGHEVENIEKKLAEYAGVKHCISCANGTDAMVLVLTAWGITKGDAVFVPNFTFFATCEVVATVGATPIFVDVLEDTFNIDPLDLESKIQKVMNEGKLKPRVVIPVDLFGLLADYVSIKKIASKYNLLILEDSAQAYGAEYDGRRACSFGDAATTSFFPAKPLGCYGDGGAIFTDSDELCILLQSLRVHGKGEDKYDNVRIGFNSRLDTVQAAILNIKFDAFIGHELGDVNKIFKIYNEMLKDYVTVPNIPEGFLSTFAQYTIKLNSKEQRDGLKRYLSEKDIPSLIYYTKTMHKQKAFAYLNNVDIDYPHSTKLVDIVLSIPIHPYLTDDEINKVVTSIVEFMGNYYKGEYIKS